MTGGAPIRVPEALPRGRARLPRQVVAESQRQRLLNGMVEAVAARGYGAATVTDVTKLARVSRTTFYENFKDKQDCFLAAYEDGAKAHFRHVVESIESRPDWLGQLRAGVHAWVEALETEPAYARTFLVEILAAGPRALERRAAIHRLWVEQLKRWHERARKDHVGLPELPDAIFEAAIAASNEILVSRLRFGGGDLADVEAKVLYVHLALSGLEEHARREL